MEANNQHNTSFSAFSPFVKSAWLPFSVRSVINLQRPKTDAPSKGFINLSLRGGRGPPAPGDPRRVSAAPHILYAHSEVERLAGTQTLQHFGFMGTFQSKCEAMTSWHYFFSYYQPGGLVKRKWFIFNSLILQVSLFNIIADEFCLGFGLFLSLDRLNKADGVLQQLWSVHSAQLMREEEQQVQQKSKRLCHFMPPPPPIVPK